MCVREARDLGLVVPTAPASKQPLYVALARHISELGSGEFGVLTESALRVVNPLLTPWMQQAPPPSIKHAVEKQLPLMFLLASLPGDRWRPARPCPRGYYIDTRSVRLLHAGALDDAHSGRRGAGAGIVARLGGEPLGVIHVSLDGDGCDGLAMPHPMSTPYRVAFAGEVYGTDDDDGEHSPCMGCIQPAFSSCSF
eukprot:scaffold2.g7500.t1